VRRTPAIFWALLHTGDVVGGWKEMNHQSGSWKLAAWQSGGARRTCLPGAVARQSICTHPVIERRPADLTAAAEAKQTKTDPTGNNYRKDDVMAVWIRAASL
jgi:hypothetical protein